jgi:DNA-binding transcriptional LysR family regulator
VHEVLYDDHDVVFASAHHRLAKRKLVSLEDLAKERWALTSGVSRPLLRYLTQEFHNRGLPTPVVALDTNSQAVRIPAIALTDYIAISSREFMRREAQKYDLVELPVKELSHSRRLSLVYRKDSYLSPAAARFMDLLREGAAKISAKKGGVPGLRRSKKI